MTGQRDELHPGKDDDKSSAAAKKKKGNPWVENIESLTVAVILALIIRVFVVEAFVIPTGSMAPGLHGDHFNMTCPNCGYRYAVGNMAVGGSLSAVRCINCGEQAAGLPSRTPSGGDRILVNKVLYHFQKPQRWDPFVFVNPNCERIDPKTTYIKRLVGLPGERLEIIRGDVIIDGKPAQKPESAQSTLWMPVYDSAYPWRLGRPWVSSGDYWKLQANSLWATVPALTMAWTQYAGRNPGNPNEQGVIRDSYGYDKDFSGAGKGRGGSGLNIVNDLRVSLDWKGEPAGRLAARLLRDDGDDTVVVDFAAGKVTLTRGARTLAEKTFTEAGIGVLDASKPHRLVFCRLDYRLVLAIDGEKALECDTWDDAAYREMVARGAAFQEAVNYGGPNDDLEHKQGELLGYARSGVELGAEAARFELKNITIDRDVYYTPIDQESTVANHYQRWDIPKGNYFAMGDNSPESSDSRFWGRTYGMDQTWVPAENLIGKGLVIWWHPSRVRLIR